MTIATEYTKEWLQETRPQPMYDKKINRLISEFFTDFVIPDETTVYDIFVTEFEEWLKASTFNKLSGFDTFSRKEVCIGCTQFIDDLYIANGLEGLMTFEGDYKYHWRLNNNINYVNLLNISELCLNDDGTKKPLLIALPFPKTGDIHIDMVDILNRCLELNIDVHVDGAWMTCSRDIEFNFNHPAIKSFAISLSKGLGLGWNRVGVRYTREHNKHNSICIMNDYNMNCRTLPWMGLHFIRNLEPDYFWKKYEGAYYKVCSDFDLIPSKAIHLAHKHDETPVGVRPLIRYLADK